MSGHTQEVHPVEGFHKGFKYLARVKIEEESKKKKRWKGLK